MSGKPSFFAELQRRNVYKVGAMYAVAGWLLVQVVTQVFPIFEVSALVQRIIVLAIVAAPEPVATASVVAAGSGADPLSLALGGARPGQTYAITAGDFNGDGKLDLAIVNQPDGTVSVLLNSTVPGGSGVSFAPAVKLGGAAPAEPNAPPPPTLCPEYPPRLSRPDLRTSRYAGNIAGVAVRGVAA